MVDKLKEVKELLKPFKTQLLFQVHDSMVFDLSPSDDFLIDKISDLLSHHKGMLFNVDYSIGKNYKDIS
jgi:DNA polymerase I-like protein with 3'-5' exonuclease and polymerase domains